MTGHWSCCKAEWAPVAGLRVCVWSRMRDVGSPVAQLCLLGLSAAWHKGFSTWQDNARCPPSRRHGRKKSVFLDKELSLTEAHLCSQKCLEKCRLSLTSSPSLPQCAMTCLFCLTCQAPVLCLKYQEHMGCAHPPL